MKLFYSWQSDIPENRNFIGKCLKEAIKDIPDFEIETATRDSKGSPDIAATILAKITDSNLFLADVSIINNESSEPRKYPNPNVMYELGYAVSELGEDNIILIADKDITKTVDLPFDIRNRRMILESFSDEKSKQSTVSAIKAAMKNYDPKSTTSEDSPPFATHNSNTLVWATNYSGFGAGFLTTINVDNFGGEQDYLISAKLRARDGFDDPWETKTFLFQETGQLNKPLPIQASEITTATPIILSDDIKLGRTIPDLDRDTVVLELLFRSGKKVELPPYKPANVRPN